MWWSKFKRYIILAIFLTIIQLINLGQILISKLICASSCQFNHHFQILLHHRESSSESNCCHVDFTLRKVSSVIYLFIYYFHYPRVQAQLMAQLMTSVYILSISVLFCLFLSPSCPSCYLASPRVLHFYSFRSLDVCHCVFQGFHVAE